MKLPCPPLAKIGGYRQSRRRKYDHVKDDLLDGGGLLGGAEDGIVELESARSSAQSDAGHYKIEASQKNDADAK